MEGAFKNIGQRVDNALTNYLRNTTTDQEILDFYGEGNIIGRKGIPEGRKEIFDQLDASKNLLFSPLRPESDRPKFNVGGIDQQIGYDYKTTDMPGVVNPATGRPWQMTFGVLPKDFGSSSLTPAAQQFLVDFRVPKNTGNDYSFATGPHIQDRIDVEVKNRLENDPYFGKQPDRLRQEIEQIKNKPSDIGDFSGQPATPKTWQEQGYITEKPANFKSNVLNEFKNRIIETQGSFGGVSTLSPVEQRGAANPQWRADLYEREGLAGPVSEQPFSSGYGGGTKDVQRFTTGKERLLPLQPYSEFLGKYDSTRSSAINTPPASDFTPFQKAVGTRNYLIGKNILEGRGSLGAGFRSGLSVGAADFIPSPEAIRDVYAGKPIEAIKKTGIEMLSGIPTAAAAGAAVAAAPALAPIATSAGGALVLNRAAAAANEVVRQQTGEDIVSKTRQFLGTTPRTDITDRPRTGSQPLTASVRPMTTTQRREHERQQNQNELQRRFRLAGQRFNPARGEFGLSEMFFGR